MFIGLETLSKKTFKDIRKSIFDPEEMPGLLRKIQKRGILIRASVMFGFDEDEKDVFENTINFLIQNKITYTDFNVLTLLPSTQILNQLEKENRIFDRDWSKYDFKNVVFHPKRMSKEELEEGFWKAAKRFYSFPIICRRNFLVKNTQLIKMTSIFYQIFIIDQLLGKKAYNGGELTEYHENQRYLKIHMIFCIS